MKIGDVVMFSAKFLRSAGVIGGRAPFRKGVVTHIQRRKPHQDPILGDLVTVL
jgi:hypothetical protein